MAIIVLYCSRGCTTALGLKKRAEKGQLRWLGYLRRKENRRVGIGHKKSKEGGVNLEREVMIW